MDSSANVPPALSSRLKAGTSHLLMSSVSHLVFEDQCLDAKAVVRNLEHTVCPFRVSSTFPQLLPNG